MTTPTARRILSEIEQLRNLAAEKDPSLVQFLLDETSTENPESCVILGRILPKSQIYNQAAFQIEIKLNKLYPFKAPEVRFITPIYHPNVDHDGKISIDILYEGGGFKPTTTLVDIVKAIVDLIDNPDLNRVLQTNTAAEYSQNRAEFDDKALKMVTKYGLPRK
ncbi:unnamed protein product [Rotaria sp. Silwood1]|nr:unnamed protein product [Rotaria sp. Silwood1]CAF5008668.1 unnamed protein product [Rotaria sp. Silwood1]